jgi:hypothetical protein
MGLFENLLKLSITCSSWIFLESSRKFFYSLFAHGNGWHIKGVGPKVVLWQGPMCTINVQPGTPPNHLQETTTSAMS